MTDAAAYLAGVLVGVPAVLDGVSAVLVGVPAVLVGCVSIFGGLRTMVVGVRPCFTQPMNVAPLLVDNRLYCPLPVIYNRVSVLFT